MAGTPFRLASAMLDLGYCYLDIGKAESGIFDNLGFPQSPDAH
jgi:hypothetical protein